MRSHSQRVSTTSAPTSNVTCMPDTASTCDTPAPRIGVVQRALDGGSFAEEQRAGDARVRCVQRAFEGASDSSADAPTDQPVEPRQPVDARLTAWLQLRVHLGAACRARG